MTESSEVCTLCAQLLFLMGKLRAEVYSQLAPLSLADFAGQLVAGLRGVLELAANTDGDGSRGGDEDLRLWVMLMVEVFTEMEVGGGNSGGVRELPPALLRELVLVLFDVMSVATEDVFLEAADALVALNAQLVFDGTVETNPFMAVLMGHADKQNFAEAVLHNFNLLGYPCKNERRLVQVLKTMQVRLRRCIQHFGVLAQHFGGVDLLISGVTPKHLAPRCMCCVHCASMNVLCSLCLDACALFTAALLIQCAIYEHIHQ
jgi:hypothetical protein